MIYEDYHCSEAFVIAVGEALKGKIEDYLAKASTLFLVSETIILLNNNKYFE